MTRIQSSDDVMPRLHELGHFETSSHFSEPVARLGRPWKLVLNLRFAALQGSYHEKLQLSFSSMLQPHPIVELTRPSLKELGPTITQHFN